MPGFSNFSDTLPDPIYLLGPAGNFAIDGAAGPGFEQVKLTSTEQMMRTNVNSGRLNTKSGSYHSWMINITYNPMTREDFEPVYAFLRYRQAIMRPFLVELPQYANQTTTDVNFYDAVERTHTEGSNMYVYQPEEVTVPVKAKPGQIFKFKDFSKVYMVSRVEDNINYLDIDRLTPNPILQRLHFTPKLEPLIYHDFPITFNPVKFLVQQEGGVLSHSLDDNNLYSFSLKLIEVTV